jgi:predicted glycoside hydrolase/deacetylase ChbG (UPF0249 family)
VNGDDFGLSTETNAAVVEAFEKGLISSATIMANMPGFEEAARLAREKHLRGRIGLHLNLTSGRPLTSSMAECPRFCDAGGCWRPRWRVLGLSGKEQLLLEAEIGAQIRACEREGITLTHVDSHHHMHAEWGIGPTVIRAVRRHGIGGVRLALNCGRGRRGASAAHRLLGRTYRAAYNMRLRLSGLAKTHYFGHALDTADILRTTTADVEVMVHPQFDERGQLIDAVWEDDGQPGGSRGVELASQLAGLCIAAREMCSY